MYVGATVSLIPLQLLRISLFIKDERTGLKLRAFSRH